jgi:hypothetical protein
MRKSLSWLILGCLCLVMTDPALASRTRRYCGDFDASLRRLANNLNRFDNVLSSDLNGMRSNKIMLEERRRELLAGRSGQGSDTNRAIEANTQLSLAIGKLDTAMRICQEAQGEVRNIRARVPSEIDCDDRKKEIRQSLAFSEDMLNSAEAKMDTVERMLDEYRALRNEADRLVAELGRRYN